jgi:hypothetical protein
MLTACLSCFAQVQEDPRRAIDAVAGIERNSDELQQSCVFSRSMALGLLQPGVIAAGSDLEDPTHQSDLMLVAM